MVYEPIFDWPVFKRGCKLLINIVRDNPRKELLILGYVITDVEALKKTKEEWQRQKLEISTYKHGGIETTNQLTVSSDEVGGAVVLVDPENMNCPPLGSVDVRAPMGLYYCQKRKILFTGSDRWILGISKGKVVRILNNQYFHCLHLLSGSQDGDLLVVSTGVDAVLKINIDTPEKLNAAWFATENGYNISANGNPRYIDKKFDHQHCQAYLTPEHTTHINSICEYRPDYLLATFFHQGELVLINLKSGQAEIVIEGLSNPHGIRKASFGYLLSDTNGQRIIKLDNSLRKIGQINGNYNWIQDAVELKNGNIAIADADNGRIVIVKPSGKFIEELVFGANKNRIGVMSTISVKEAMNIFN